MLINLSKDYFSGYCVLLLCSRRLLFENHLPQSLIQNPWYAQTLCSGVQKALWGREALRLERQYEILVVLVLIYLEG